MRLLIILIVSIFLNGCSVVYQSKNILGETLPSMLGETLEEKNVEIPGMFTSPLTLLLVGYKQDSQFDIDRWLIGLDMTKTDVSVYEVPAIQGMFPRMFKTYINNGMRAGIPKELWKGVITLYADGETMQQFTGNEHANNTRVILINDKATVLYFYDRGFSVNALNEVRTVIDNY